jgi:hypothetical protein
MLLPAVDWRGGERMRRGHRKAFNAEVAENAEDGGRSGQV